MIGFDTIGSATIVVHDDVPVLSTDAWLNDDAYFGSWAHDYEIPAEQRDAIRRAKFHWFSHGHPDHLNVESLPLLSGGRVLLADHLGGRIAADLRGMGLDVTIMPDRTWMQLSPRVRVQSIANANQDSVLLIDVNGRLLINTNDAPDLGWSPYIRKLARDYRMSYLTELCGWGGADMSNLYTPDGEPIRKDERPPIGIRLQRRAALYGAKRVIPFSSFHRYQRSDSVWANDLVPELHDYRAGAEDKGAELLPPFVRVDCQTDAVQPLEPARLPLVVRPSEDFGDDWSESLDAEDRRDATAYFQAFAHLQRHFGFIRLRVGGTDTHIDLNRSMGDVGLTFEAPRNSLMFTIRNDIFDDMLIGNYMRTTLHGGAQLYPHFSPYVAKYGDNGKARSERELRGYFAHYRGRDPIGPMLLTLGKGAESVFRRVAPSDSAMFRAAKQVYWHLKSR